MHCLFIYLTKQQTVLGKHAWEEGSRAGNPKDLLTMALSPRFYGNGISFQVVFGQSSGSEYFLVARMLFNQDECQQVGFWEMDGHVKRLLLIFPILFWLVLAYKFCVS